jgi:hypothetical protein
VLAGGGVCAVGWGLCCRVGFALQAWVGCTLCRQGVGVCTGVGVGFALCRVGVGFALCRVGVEFALCR